MHDNWLQPLGTFWYFDEDWRKEELNRKSEVWKNPKPTKVKVWEKVKEVKSSIRADKRASMENQMIVVQRAADNSNSKTLRSLRTSTLQPQIL